RWDDLSVTERAGLFDGIAESAGRMQRLVADLLTISSLEVPGGEDAAPSTVVVEVLRPLVETVRSVNPGLTVEVDQEVDIRVRMDPIRLAQVLDNLLRNAVVHGDSPIRISLDQSDDMVEVCFFDGGSGVPEALRGRLF